MIIENLGKIAITPKGQWVAGTYERLDLVTDAGSSYISLKDNNVSALNTADWMLVAEKGDTGNGIQSITLLSTVGLVKTYRITYTNGTTYDYTVTDGAGGGGGIDLSAYLTELEAQGLYQPIGAYITDETDPTVPDWAKAATKPTYTAAEVIGLQAELDSKVDDSQVLTNVPAGALFTDTVYTHPATHEATIIEQDATHRFVTDTEKSTWSGKAEAIHNHDDRYYTEGEIDTIKNDLLNLIYAGL